MSDLREEFIQLLSSVNREGINNLVDWIKDSTFFDDPASTRYHGSYNGGLLTHTMNVYDILQAKVKCGQWANLNFSDDTIKIVALLHDICKIGTYQTEMRNKKDEHGKWISVPFYVKDDPLPYGHGEKSAMMADGFIKLSREERFAIRWHMGFSEPKELWGDLGKAIEMYPLILALHEADMEATYLLESSDSDEV